MRLKTSQLSSVVSAIAHETYAAMTSANFMLNNGVNTQSDDRTSDLGSTFNNNNENQANSDMNNYLALENSAKGKKSNKTSKATAVVAPELVEMNDDTDSMDYRNITVFRKKSFSNFD
jgi:hypothetical protein